MIAALVLGAATSRASLSRRAATARSGPGHEQPGSLKNDVGIALARPAHGAQAVDDRGFGERRVYVQALREGGWRAFVAGPIAASN